ncbi:HAMP domain-containing histidine kinase [Pseudaestuariivita atlantica]|uniref:histidine kinase n=1 Tax=Pseudaestuariivita atlantica TaxID=1317121 RepID=A0A0L1JLP0_9RHOB|nr:HAMP domain-containing histidine kinase [Pseudaestuariivita atlantica]KNG92666.1 ATPase [Pseudaestuariivita atlantica]
MQDNPKVSGSLRKRLVLTLIGGAALLAFLLFLAVRNFAVQVAQQGQDNILFASASSMLDAASLRDGVVEVDLPYSAFAMLTTPADDRVFYAIYEDGTFLSGYDDLPFFGSLDDDRPRYRTAQMRGATVRQISAHRTLIGANRRINLQIVLAQTQDALSETLDRIFRTAALLGVSFFALAAAMSLWVTSSTMGQLNRLTTSVTRRGPQDLSPFRNPVPQEMAPLVKSLNSLMGRLDHSLSQSEDFIAEAAHRVRTPLATVRSYAEATLQRVDKEENREAMRSMIKAIDESSRTAGQLLDHAMITFRADQMERREFDLVELLRELVLQLAPIAEMKDLALNLHGAPSVPYAGDPILIQNAVRNLIDNAMKYGPAESAVDITVTAGPPVRITVCDEGPGFPADEIDRLTTRFARGQNAEGKVGSGLGLTIAQDVAGAHGGSIELSNREEGGACVTLLL